MNMRDYESTRRSFRLDVPEGFNYTRDVVEGWAEREPGRTALVWLDAAGRRRRELSFAEVARGARRFANVLGALGVGPGERAFVMLPRVPEWYDALLGMFRAGVVAMPATTQLTERDIASRVARAEASLAVVDEAGAALLAEVADDCPALRHVLVVGDPPDGRFLRLADLMARASDAPPAPRPTRREDPLLVYFTSGTVAEPKMVLHTHASYGAGHDVTARFWQDLTPDDLHWTVSDTGWAKAAWGMLFGQWRVGAAVFMWDQRGKLDPEQLLRVLAGSGVTTFCAPPTLYRALVQLRPGRRRPGVGAPRGGRRRAAQPRGHPRLAARPPGPSCATATDRPRRSTSWPATPACRSARARWASPRPASTSTWWERTASASATARRAASPCGPSRSGRSGSWPATGATTRPRRP